MSHFLSASQLAELAENYVRRMYDPLPTQQKIYEMIEYVRKTHYHIVSQEIIDACRQLGSRTA